MAKAKKKTKAAAKKAAPKKKVAPEKKAAPKKKVAPKKPARAATKRPATKKPATKKPATKKPATKKPAAKPKAAPTKKKALPGGTGRESMTLETALLASPERVYAAWIDSGEHSEFTGGEAIIDAREGGKHSAWSGYIEGRFLELDPGKRLVMTWRTTEFDEADPDSHLEVRFHADGGGTRLELVHTELPPGGENKYTTGWREFYFVPMAKYFG